MPSAVGTATLDLGAVPGSTYASVNVVGQTGLTATGHVEAWLQGDSTASHNDTEHLIVPLIIRCGSVATGSFTIHASTEMRLTGTFLVHWVWSN